MKPWFSKLFNEKNFFINYKEKETAVELHPSPSLQFLQVLKGIRTNG
jgi:hypothetical protein